jgi:hypothetical protein
MTRPANEGWVPCPSGELERFSYRLGRERRRKKGIGVTLGTAVSAAVGVIALAVVDWSHTERPVQPTVLAGTTKPIIPDCRPAPEGGCDSKR